MNRNKRTGEKRKDETDETFKRSAISIKRENQVTMCHGRS